MRNIIICNKKGLFEHVLSTEELITWLENNDDFNSFEWPKNIDNTRIFILAELKWNDSFRHTDFYGFELVRRLRLRNIQCPIFVFSFLPKEYFLELKSPVFQILRASFAHPFLQLPLEDLSSELNVFTMNLSNYQLDDIKFHFFDTQGLLDEYIHHLKNIIINKDFERIKDIMQQIHYFIPEEHLSLFRSINEDFVSNIQSGQVAVYKLITDLKMRIQTLLPPRYVSVNEIKTVHNWRILLIDDNLQLLEELNTRFSVNGIQCLNASSGVEAFSILEQDFQGKLINADTGQTLSANSIAVVVSDLRFIDEHGDWQPWQGYDIIEKIAQMPNFVSFFVLTSKKGAILDQIARMNHLRINWYAKEDILDETSPKVFSLFCNKVRLEGDQTHEALLSTPKVAAWLNPWDVKKRKWPLRDYYGAHRLSSNYFQEELKISQCASDFIYEAELVRERRLKKIGSIGFSKEFQGNLPGDPGDEASMEHFYTKLIGRRIALGLHLKGWSAGKISDILKLGYLDAEDLDKGLFSTHLALSTNMDKDIPYRLLVEERSWVEHTLGYALGVLDRHLFQAISSALGVLQDEFRKRNSAEDFLDEEIVIGTKEHVYQYLQKAYSIASEVGVETMFRRGMEKLLADQKYSDSIRRIGLADFIQSLTKQ